MRRYVTLVIVVLSLILVLTIPAGASKPEAVTGSLLSGIPHEDVVRHVGNRCLVSGTSSMEFDGQIDGTGEHTFFSVGHGLCPEELGPFLLDETIHEEGTFTGTVLGSDEGTFVYRCQNVWRTDDPETWMLDCNIRGGTGGLSGLHGHLTLYGPKLVYEGSVHFDPQP
jgi:hypothetical protein